MCAYDNVKSSFTLALEFEALRYCFCDSFFLFLPRVILVVLCLVLVTTSWFFGDEYCCNGKMGGHSDGNQEMTRSDSHPTAPNYNGKKKNGHDGENTSM